MCYHGGPVVGLAAATMFACPRWRSGAIVNKVPEDPPFASRGVVWGDWPVRIRSRILLCDGSRHSGVSHTPLPSDSPGALALGDPLASDTPLHLGQLGLAAHVHTTLAGSSSAVVGTFHEPLALVLRQGTQESDEAATDRGRQV